MEIYMRIDLKCKRERMALCSGCSFYILFVHFNEEAVNAIDWVLFL